MLVLFNKISMAKKKTFATNNENVLSINVLVT